MAMSPLRATQHNLVRHYVEQFQLADHLNSDLLRCLQLYRLEEERALDLDTPALARLYFLVAGSVDVSYDHLDGTRSTIGTLTPLALIGELDLFVEPNLRLSITASELCTFLYIERDFALRYGANDPRFLRLVIQNLSAKLIRSTLILRHNVLPLTGQVAALLLTQSSLANPKLQIRSKNYLAELVGTTPRHLNRILHNFVADGIITMDENVVEIRDRHALALHAKF
jgi:CRP-like cAMP-binding protein